MATVVCLPSDMAAQDKLILLVEDSDDDAFFFRRELRKAHLANPVQHVHTVDQAICYIDAEGEFADRSKFPAAAIIILDLHLPTKDGFEFLRWLGQNPQLRNLHVIAMSGVGRLQEINRAYQLGANSFLTKPIKAEDLRNLASGFSAVWA